VIKSRTVRWAECVESKGEVNMRKKFYSYNLKGTDHLGKPGVYRRTILKWIPKK